MIKMWMMVAGIIGGVAVVGGATAFVYKEGKAAGREEMLTRSVEILRERSQTDEDVKSMDDAELCRLLGGVFADGSCE